MAGTGNHLQIGAGIGEASSLNLNPSIATFTNVLNQQRAQRLAEKQQLINQIGSIDTTKLRKPDQSDYFDKFNDWQQSAVAAQDLPQNSREKMEAQGLALQKLNNLKSFIGASAQAGAEHKQIGNQLLQDSFRHQFKDDAVQKYIESNNLPMSDPNFISDPNTLERQIDHQKVDEALDKSMGKALKNTNNWSMTKVPGKTGDKTGTWIQQANTIPVDGENGVYHRLFNARSASPEFKKALDDSYPDQIGDPVTQIQQYAKDKGWDNGYGITKEPVFKPNYAPDKFYAHYDYRLENPLGQNPPAQPQPMNIPYAGGATVHAPNYVPLSLPNKNFAGASGVNLETGKPEKGLASSDTYSIVGAGDFPVVKQGLQGAGTLVQPGYAQQNPNSIEYKRMVHVQQKDPISEAVSSHLIPYENLPANVSNQKDVRQALGGLNKTPVFGTQPQPDGSYKNVTQAKDSKGNVVSLGYKNGKWYNVKTNQAVE